MHPLYLTRHACERYYERTPEDASTILAELATARRLTRKQALAHCRLDNFQGDMPSAILGTANFVIPVLETHTPRSCRHGSPTGKVWCASTMIPRRRKSRSRVNKPYRSIDPDDIPFDILLPAVMGTLDPRDKRHDYIELHRSVLVEHLEIQQFIRPDAG